MNIPMRWMRRAFFKCTDQIVQVCILDLLIDRSSLITDLEPLYEVPDLKEYFRDLEYISNVVADGPAKSFAFRRLKYLEGKWNMYVLLNEYQELAAMKVHLQSMPTRISSAHTISLI